MQGVQAIENAAPATIGPPLPARSISASTRHSRLRRSTNIAAMKSTPITIRSTAPMSVRVSWFSRSELPICVAARPSRMKIVENEAMKRRLGTRTRRQSPSPISPGLTPVITDR